MRIFEALVSIKRRMYPAHAWVEFNRGDDACRQCLACGRIESFQLDIMGSGWEAEEEGNGACHRYSQARNENEEGKQK